MTPLHHVLHSRGGVQVAIIMDNMNEANIDSQLLLKAEHGSAARKKSRLK